MAVAATTIFVGLPLLLAWALTQISRKTKAQLATLFGVAAQLYLGALGVIIHEGSHLIAALIFRHKIIGFRLIVTPRNLRNEALGYVNHAWNNYSRYQRLGNAAIGLAPIVGCTLVLRMMAYFLVNDWYNAAVDVMRRAVHLDFSHGFVLAACKLIYGYNIASWRGVLLVGLSLSVALGGFDLSASDFKTAAKALGVISLILFLSVWLAICVGGTGTLVGVMSDYVSKMFVVMGLSFMWTLLASGICRLLFFILN